MCLHPQVAHVQTKHAIQINKSSYCSDVCSDVTFTYKENIVMKFSTRLCLQGHQSLHYMIISKKYLITVHSVYTVISEDLNFFSVWQWQNPIGWPSIHTLSAAPVSFFFPGGEGILAESDRLTLHTASAGPSQSSSFLDRRRQTLPRGSSFFWHIGMY
jgi:hypothetical protein